MSLSRPLRRTSLASTGIVAAGAAITVSRTNQDGFPKVVERWISTEAASQDRGAPRRLGQKPAR
jgi:hypothetical protein